MIFRGGKTRKFLFHFPFFFGSLHTHMLSFHYHILEMVFEFGSNVVGVFKLFVSSNIPASLSFILKILLTVPVLF